MNYFTILVLFNISGLYRKEGPTSPPTSFFSSKRWERQRKGERAIPEACLHQLFQGRTLPLDLGRRGVEAAPAAAGGATVQAPFVDLDQPGPQHSPAGIQTPEFPPAQLEAVVQALTANGAFTAAIVSRVFATPASATAELEDVIMVPQATEPQ